MRELINGPPDHANAAHHRASLKNTYATDLGALSICGGASDDKGADGRTVEGATDASGAG